MSNVFVFRRPPHGVITEYFGGGKGGSSTTTNNVTQIPPEVLARYNAVNARAEAVAQQPYQAYSNDPNAFVAPLNATQQAGIQNTNIMAGAAQPYYQSATQQLMQAQEGAQPGINAAYTNVANAQNIGNQFANIAGQQYGQAQNVGDQYANAAAQQYGSAQNIGNQYAGAAGQQYATAQGAAAPYYQAATQGLGAALNYANPLNQAAAQAAGGAFGAAAPYYQAATQGTQQALQGAQPYQGLATAAALSGAQAVDPSQLNVSQYMNPFTQSVVKATQAAMNQQQGQQLAQQQAEAIRSGAFGGERAGLQRGQLRGQQSLAQAQAIAPLYQQNYNQALAAAQQQQGVGLGAGQANRAAIQQAGQQLGALGQQTYGQQLGAANQMANLGQNLYGQRITGAQTLSQLGQTGYGQQLSASQQAQALGQGLYGQALATGQALQGLGQQQYGQGLGIGQAQAALGQQQYGQNLGIGQAYQGLGQQQYGQGMTTAQQQAALAQQGYGMGANTSTLLGSIGTNAQQAGLAGAQAQMQAGQAQQQTQQAGLQAMYNQFLQQQGFPYQQAQFLANIATGTGALSGNASSGTSTTTGGGGFFSDERLKENIKKVGETNDGQPIYRYNYKGDGRTQIGLLAQDVEKDHPEAVGLAGGYKTVDYKKATEDAVHKADGGSATDAYAISPSAGNSQMLQENSGKGLGVIPSLPQMITGPQRIEAGANAAQLAALRAPQARGYSLGTREGKEAELASLQSSMTMPPGPNGELLGSGKPYLESRINTLQDWLNKNNSQGGLVSGPGNFARGGLAEGGYMNPALAYYSPQQAQGGLYGVQLQPLAQRQILQGTPMQAPPQRQQPDAVTSAMNMAKLVEMGDKARPDFLRSAADVAARQRTADALAAKEQQYIDWAKEKGYPLPSDKKVAEILPEDRLVVPEVYAARGGLIGDRHHYSRGGINPYGGLGGNDILGPIIEEQDTSRRLSNDKVTPPPAPKQQSDGLGQLAQMANTGKSLYKGGEWAADKLGLGASPTAMSATSTGAMPGVIDLTSGAGIAGAAPEALSAGLAGGEALAGGAAAAEGLAAGAGLAELGAGAAAAGAGIMEALPFLAFLSDERAKHDIKKVGTLFDGQPVYRYAYNGDDKTQMGLLAQKVEKAAPEAVGLAGGMKTVNYKKATDKAAKRGHYQTAGLVPPEDAPVVVEEVGGNETATTGGDGETVVGRGAPLARQTRPVPTPDNAVVATTLREPPPGVASASRPPMPSKSFLPEITSEGVRDTLSSENFWVPALAGLGSMLASPNKTLAGAIGSGLVGGTTAYTGLQKQQADQLMKRLEMSKGRFKGPTLQGDQDMYLDTIVGDYVTEAEMGRRQGQFIGAKVSGTAMGAPAQSPTPGGRAATDAVETAKKTITEEAPAIQPRAPAPPAKKEEAAAQPSAATPTPKPAEPDPNRILTKPEMIAAARQNESLFQHLPEDRRPLALEAEAKRLEDEGKAYLRQSQEEARRSGLTKGSDERGRLEAASKRFADLAKDRREEAAKRREEANNLFEGAIALQVKEAEARIGKIAEFEAAPQIAPTGEKVVLRPGSTLPATVAPKPTPEQEAAPKKATVDAKTGQLMLARPVAPAGGGLIQSNFGTGTKIAEQARVQKAQEEDDAKFLEDFRTKGFAVSKARQQYHGLMNAFKMFQSGSGETSFAGLGAIMQSFGYTDLARKVASGEPAAVQYAQKIAPELVLETLKAANPRFAQSEFTVVNDKGVPEPNKLPEVNFQMVKAGLAYLNRTEAFAQSWQRASQEEGWRSPSAYYDKWSAANPISVFEQAAERQMGNFRGMDLPSADKWAPGTIYVVPNNLSTTKDPRTGISQAEGFAKMGMKPGDPFRYNGPEASQTITPIDPKMLFSTPAVSQ